MKKVLIIIATGTLAVASCSTDNTAAEAQAQVDSIVNAKTGLLQAQMKRNNDSIINAMAVARADSMMAKTAAPAKRDSNTVAR